MEVSFEPNSKTSCAPALVVPFSTIIFPEGPNSMIALPTVRMFGVFTVMVLFSLRFVFHGVFDVMSDGTVASS